MLCTLLFRQNCHTQLVEFQNTPSFICTSVACAVGPIVSTSSTDFFPFKTWFFWNLFEFSAAEITLKSISLAHSNSSEIFSYDFILFYFIFSEEINSIFKNFGTVTQVQTSWNQSPWHPSSQRELSKDTKEHDLKHPGLVNLITTKQNKLPSFIDRCTIMYFRSL